VQHKNEHLILLNQLFKEIFNHFPKLTLESILLFRILINYQLDINSKDKFFRDIHEMSSKLFEQILSFLTKYLNEKNMSKVLVPKDTSLSMSELLKLIDDEFISEVRELSDIIRESKLFLIYYQKETLVQSNQKRSLTIYACLYSLY
jgi:hypothetical protein